jgi:endonuclease YncB( thermonuclease family)
LTNNKRLNRITLLLILALFLFTNIAFARNTIRTVTGTVTKVSDGDTITVHTSEETKLKVRLYGIDAPETEKSDHRTGHISKPGQPYGEESQSYLTALVLNKTVRLDILDIDKYRRMVAIVWLGNKNANLEMIKTGMAGSYVKYLKDEPYKTQFIQAEKDAKDKKLGVWSLGAYSGASRHRNMIHLATQI